eukprot:Gb_22624 [translate_table: standard]
MFRNQALMLQGGIWPDQAFCEAQYLQQILTSLLPVGDPTNIALLLKPPSHLKYYIQQLLLHLPMPHQLTWQHLAEVEVSVSQ